MDIQHISNIDFIRQYLGFSGFSILPTALRLPTTIHIHNNNDRGRAAGKAKSWQQAMNRSDDYQNNNKTKKVRKAPLTTKLSFYNKTNLIYLLFYPISFSFSFCFFFFVFHKEVGAGRQLQRPACGQASPEKKEKKKIIKLSTTSQPRYPQQRRCRWRRRDEGIGASLYLREAWSLQRG